MNGTFSLSFPLSNDKQFHRLILISLPPGGQFYVAACQVCRKAGRYKDLRQETCHGPVMG